MYKLCKKKEKEKEGEHKSNPAKMISEQVHAARNLSHINMMRGEKNPQATSINYDQHDLPYMSIKFKIAKKKYQKSRHKISYKKNVQRKFSKAYSQYCGSDSPET